MKYVFVFFLQLMSSFAFCQTIIKSNKPSVLTSIEKSKIIGKPIQYDGIELTQSGFPNMMTYAEAKEACKRLGSGWRLPNWDEMNTILRYSQEKNIFVVSHYIWGESFIPQESTERIYPFVEIDATYYHPEGNFAVCDKERIDTVTAYVWPVRNIVYQKKK